MTRDATVPAYPVRAQSAWPYLLSLVGGILILIEGIILALIGPFVLTVAGDMGLGTFLFGLAVIVLGVVVIWAAYRLRANPAGHVAYGAAIIIFSVLALVLAGGGFIIGSFLGIIGGAWAIVRT